MKKFKLIWESGTENSLKSSMAKGLKNLFSTGGTVLKEKENVWKNWEHK
jgi:hypothetical protein